MLWMNIALAAIFVAACLGVWLVIIHGAKPIDKDDPDLKKHVRDKYSDDEGDTHQ